MNRLELKTWLFSIFDNPCGRPSTYVLPWFQVALGASNVTRRPATGPIFSFACRYHSTEIMSFDVACQFPFAFCSSGSCVSMKLPDERTSRMSWFDHEP